MNRRDFLRRTLGAVATVLVAPASIVVPPNPVKTPMIALHGYWVRERAVFLNCQVTYGDITLNVKKLTVMVKFPNELLR